MNYLATLLLLLAAGAARATPWEVSANPTWTGQAGTTNLQWWFAEGTPTGAMVGTVTTIPSPTVGVWTKLSDTQFVNSGRTICAVTKAVRVRGSETVESATNASLCQTFAAAPPPLTVPDPPLVRLESSVPPPSTSGWGPTSFNDARFTSMTSGSLGCGTVSNRSSTTRGATFCPGTVSWNMVRANQTDDILQVANTTGIVDYSITDGWLQTFGDAAQGDHADAIQSWVAGEFRLTLTRVTMSLAATAGNLDGTGIRNGDAGRVALLKLDHVYIKGPGQGIRSYTPDGTPYLGMHVWVDGLCLENSDAVIGAWNGGTITVDRWANAYTGCSIVGGQVVTGTALKCSSVVTPNPSGNPSAGKVIGCPS